MNCDCDCGSYGQFYIIDPCEDMTKNIISTCKCTKVSIPISIPNDTRFYYSHPKIRVKPITKQLIEMTIILILVIGFILFMNM